MSDFLKLASGISNSTEETQPLPTPESASHEAPPQNWEFIPQAKACVAEYLRDLGLRDPDVVAQESQAIVQKAQEELASGVQPTCEMLCETAIRLTVKQMESLLALLAAQSNQEEMPERLGSSIAARLPKLLRTYPKVLNQQDLPAELVDSLRTRLNPVVPPTRPQRMRQQVLLLVPPFVMKAYTRLRVSIWGAEGSHQEGER